MQLYFYCSGKYEIVIYHPCCIPVTTQTKCRLDVACVHAMSAAHPSEKIYVSKIVHASRAHDCWGHPYTNFRSVFAHQRSPGLQIKHVHKTRSTYNHNKIKQTQLLTDYSSCSATFLKSADLLSLEICAPALRARAIKADAQIPACSVRVHSPFASGLEIFSNTWMFSTQQTSEHLNQNHVCIQHVIGLVQDRDVW